MVPLQVVYKSTRGNLFIYVICISCRHFKITSERNVPVYDFVCYLVKKPTRKKRPRSNYRGKIITLHRVRRGRPITILYTSRSVRETFLRVFWHVNCVYIAIGLIRDDSNGSAGNYVWFALIRPRPRHPGGNIRQSSASKFQRGISSITRNVI